MNAYIVDITNDGDGEDDNNGNNENNSIQVNDVSNKDNSKLPNITALFAENTLKCFVYLLIYFL